MASFWFGESTKDLMSSTELALTYPATNDYGKMALLHDSLFVQSFLEHHYDAQMPDLMKWLLDTAVLHAKLVHVPSQRIVAYMCGLEFATNLPSCNLDSCNLDPCNLDSCNEKPILLGTLLCVHTALRRTGLVKKFLASVIKYTAERGYAIRVSTTPDVLRMRHSAQIFRYVLPQQFQRQGRPAATQDELNEICPKFTAPGIHWINVKAHDSLYVHEISGKFGALFVKVNGVSFQLLAMYKNASDFATYLQEASVALGGTLIIDTIDPQPEMKQSSRIPFYYVYFHNVQTEQCFIPMI